MNDDNKSATHKRSFSLARLLRSKWDLLLPIAMCPVFAAFGFSLVGILIGSVGAYVLFGLLRMRADRSRQKAAERERARDLAERASRAAIKVRCATMWRSSAANLEFLADAAQRQAYSARSCAREAANADQLQKIRRWADLTAMAANAAFSSEEEFHKRVRTANEREIARGRR